VKTLLSTRPRPLRRAVEIALHAGGGRLGFTQPIARVLTLVAADARASSASHSPASAPASPPAASGPAGRPRSAARSPLAWYPRIAHGSRPVRAGAVAGRIGQRRMAH
jgi:hypothetical protein